MSTAAGIDIGAEAIKGVVLKGIKPSKKDGPGELVAEVVAAGTMPIGDLTRMPESPDRALAIGEKLKELVRSARLKADTRRVGASGGKTSLRYLQIPPVPPWRLEMLVKYEVEEKGEEKEANTYDYHIMDVPETNGQYTVIVGLCRESFAYELMSQAKSSGLSDVEIDLEALALYSAYYHGHGFDHDKTVAIADIGAEDLTVLVCKNGALYYARTILGGGRRFTQNLADDLKLEWSEAEELKKTSAEITFEPSPAASSIGRQTRIQRPGGSLMMSRPNIAAIKTGASAVLPGVQAVEGGAPPAGLPARSAVTQAPTAASGSAAPSGNPDETRRARMPDISKMVRPGGNVSGASQSKAAPAVAPAPEEPAQAATAPAVQNKPSSEAFAELDLDTIPLVPVSAPPAKPAASVPVSSKPAPALVDDFELQPVGEADEGVKAPGAKAAPQIAPAPKAPEPVRKPAPSVSNVEVVDLLPLNDTIGGGGPSAQDALDQSLTASGVSARPEMPEDRDRRRRQITAALVREAAGLCAAIENVVLNSKQQSKQATFKLDRLYVTGGGSKLKGLSEFMGRRLRVEVLPLEPLRCLSLSRLSPAQADALREEQHTLGVALGLALSDLRKGAYSFYFCPTAVKNRREFWARGAYLYYAAGAAALAMGALMYTPYANTDMLNRNFEIAEKNFKDARGKNEDVKRNVLENNELRQRLTTVTSNVQSGDYFLNLLAELKSKKRIQDDIFLTSVSTTIPNVALVESLEESGARGGPNTRPVDTTNKEPDSFLAQRRVYLRGFARGPNKDQLIQPIEEFRDKLVPFRAEPNNPANLFKDIRVIWISREENKTKEGLYLSEFVLEAYTELAEEKKTEKKDEKKGKKGGAPSAAPGAPEAPKLPGPPAMPVAQPTLEQPAAIPVKPAAVQPQPVPVLVQPAPIPTQPVPVQPVPVPIQPAPIPAQPVPPIPAPVQPAPIPAQPVPPVPAPVQPAPIPTQPVPVPIRPVPVPAKPAPVQPVPVPVQPAPVPAQPVPVPPVPAPAVVAPVNPPHLDVPKKKPVYVLPDDAVPPAVNLQKVEK